MKSIIFNSFSLDTENGIKNVFESLLTAPYSDERGFGFENIEIEDNILSATLIKRNATYIYEYDSAAKEMLKRQIMLFLEIHFQIDFNYELLCVFGQAIYVAQLKSALRNAFDFSFISSHTDLSPYKIYLALNEKGINFEFQSIAIERFVFKNGISGKLIGEVIDNIVATELVDKYKSDVNKVLFKITIAEDDNFGLQASNNGAMKFFGPEDTFRQNFIFFKQTLFKKNL